MPWGFTKHNVGIDIRQEISNLLRGSSDLVPIGQWIIYRRFDLTQKSPHFNEYTQEGVGGYKYDYTDELILTYKWNSWVSAPFNEVLVKPGEMSIPLVTFFFEYDVSPKEQDEIFEFDWDDHTVTPVLENIPKPYAARYDIKNLQTFRLDRGRIEFYAARSIKENVKH